MHQNKVNAKRERGERKKRGHFLKYDRGLSFFKDSKTSDRLRINTKKVLLWGGGKF